MAKPEHVSDELPESEHEKSIVEMIEENRRKRFRDAVMKWRGKIHLDIDIDEMRGRNRH